MDACAVNIYHLQRRACQWPLSMGSACGHEIAHICIYIYIYICVDIHVCGYSTVRRLGMALLASCTRMRWKHGQNPVSPSGCTYIRNDKKNSDQRGHLCASWQSLLVLCIFQRVLS